MLDKESPLSTGERFDAYEMKDEGREHFIRLDSILNCSDFSSKMILDCGCGTGWGTHYLSKNSKAKQIIGIDKDIESIKFAHNKYLLKNNSFALGNIITLPFKDNTFDYIICIEVIEHIIDYNLLLIEIERILKKNGVLFISSPNKKMTSPGLGKPLNPRHVREFYFHEFKEILERHFEVAIYGENYNDPKSLEQHLKRLKITLYKRRFKYIYCFLQLIKLTKLIKIILQMKNGRIITTANKKENINYTISSPTDTSIVYIGICSKKWSA